MRHIFDTSGQFNHYHPCRHEYTFLILSETLRSSACFVFLMLFVVQQKFLDSSTSSDLFAVRSSDCLIYGGRRGRDRMVFGFTTTCAISTYNH